MTAGKAKAAAEIALPAMSAVTIRKRRISECRAPGVSHGEPFFIVSSVSEAEKAGEGELPLTALLLHLGLILL